MGGHGRVKIIAGSARNIEIDLPSSARPTLSRVKEGMFSSIHFELSEGDVKCLDLCAGSGALGIEALSRGADSCVFVESNRNACQTIQNNLRITGFENSSQVVLSDAKSFVRQFRYENYFDIIFFDPPYEDDELVTLIESLPTVMKEGARLLVESSKPINKDFNELKLQKSYRYGAVHVTKFVKQSILSEDYDNSNLSG